MRVWAYFIHKDFNTTPLQRINKVVGVIVIILSLTISLPLTIITFISGGGSWGFGLIGIPILLPLAGYIFFGISGIIHAVKAQRAVFIFAHIVTISTGLICLLIFPLYPVLVGMLPVTLGLLGILSRKKYSYFLLLMMVLAVVANFLLLKWELDFDRTLPVLQLF